MEAWGLRRGGSWRWSDRPGRVIAPQAPATSVKMFLALPHLIRYSLNHSSILPRSHPHVPPQSRHHPAALGVAVASVRSERAPQSYALPDVIDADTRLTSLSPPLNWAESVALRVGVLLV